MIEVPTDSHLQIRHGSMSAAAVFLCFIRLTDTADVWRLQCPWCHTNTGMTAALALLQTTQFGLALHWRYIGEPAHEKYIGVGDKFEQACELSYRGVPYCNCTILRL